MKCNMDIRKSATYMNAAIMLALMAAIASYATPGSHGSHANSNMLSAFHWLLVILLVVAYLGPAKCINADVEVIWLVYGFLFGELDLEDAACTALVVVSAVSFHVYRRMHAKERIAAATPDPDCEAPGQGGAAF